MENLKEETKIKAFLTRIKAEWPGVVERFEFKTGSVIYVHLKEGISSMDFLGKLSRQVERFVDFSMPIILYHIESDGMNLRSHPLIGTLPSHKGNLYKFGKYSCLNTGAVK